MSRFVPDRSHTYHPSKALSREHMPTGFDISLQRYTNGLQVRIPEDYGPTQSLTGFDPDYRNIVDYIVRITHRIWETDNREVEYIADCYSPDSLVYDDYGLQTGNQKIIADTHHTTGAFPDIILDAEEVIWAGDENIAFHTSHLTRIMGTNTGESRYGEATNAKINVPVIANCVAKGNDIFLEHVLYNTSAMLKQLGIDLWAEANRLVADPPKGWPRTAQVWDELRSATAPRPAISISQPIDSFDPDKFSRAVHDNIWNGDASAISQYYSPTIPFEGTTDRKFDGADAYRDYVNSLRDTFPNLQLQVDEVYWMGNDADGYLISTRWSAEGTHSAGTQYLEPTGADCQIWGITQWRVKSEIIEQEWQLFNEFDLMMQIVKARHRD